MGVIGTMSAKHGGGRLPTISIVHKRLASREIVAACRAQQIVCRNGAFLSSHVLRAVGIHDLTDGVVRFSLLHYNTMAEVEKLIATLRGIHGWISADNEAEIAQDAGHTVAEVEKLIAS